MAIFGFGKNKEGPKQSAPGSPIDQIMAMRQRGIGNDQIISELEKQGYNSSQIFDALNQANIGGGNMAQAPPDMNAPPQDDFSQTPPGPYDQQQFDHGRRARQADAYAAGAEAATAATTVVLHVGPAAKGHRSAPLSASTGPVRRWSSRRGSFRRQPWRGRRRRRGPRR